MRLDQTFGQSRHVACASGCRSMRTSLEEGIKLHRFAGIFPEQFMTEAGRHREPPSPTVLVVPEDEKLKIHSRSIDEGRARLVLPLFPALPAHRLARRVLRLEPQLRRPADRRVASTQCPPAPSGRHDRTRSGRHPSDVQRTGWNTAWPCQVAWRAAACARSAAGRAGRQVDMGLWSD